MSINQESTRSKARNNQVALDTTALATDPKYDEVIANARPILGPHNIPRKRQVSNTFCRIFSIKAGMRIVEVESLLEANAIYYAEGTPDVLELCEQPVRIPIPVERKPYITLDLGVHRTDGSQVLYEIKPETRLTTTPEGMIEPENWALISRWCRHHGYQCEVLTSKTLNANKLLIRNWRLLLPFVRIAKENANPSLDDRILSIINTHESIALTHIVDHLPSTVTQQEVMASVSNILHSDRAVCDLNKELVSMHTRIEKKENA